jgi:radical SAM superfamily enzyme YgiQ (UPF0313 family)
MPNDGVGSGKIDLVANVLLISTYDLGRQPFGLASPAAWLRRDAHEVTCVDVTRSRLDPAAVAGADVIGFFLPMHTATRLALPLIDRVREINPAARLIAYGLYAPLSAETLRQHGVHTILGAEFEGALAREVRRCGGSVVAEVRSGSGSGSGLLERLTFIQPDRAGLPPLSRYATLQVGDARRIAGYTEATRGCKHRCRHCPIVPVYNGRFRAIDADVVLADIRAQVPAGAQHITFGDPDFLNGPTHAIRILDRFAAEFPGVTFDATIKVEHLHAHADLLPRLRDAGCAFVTTAVESIDDETLAALDKGHTRADFEAVVRHCREIGLPLSPTFVAFTPWTTLHGYCEMLHAIDELELVTAVAPVQYAIRLLIPEGSRMLELSAVRERVTHFDAGTLTHVWRHADSRVDDLQAALERLAGTRVNASRADFFERVWTVAHEAAGRPSPRRHPLPSRATVPYLNEPWYC